MAELEEDIDKKIKSLKHKQIENAVLAVVTLIALLVIGLAWFVKNSQVTSTGMMVSAEGKKYYLATLESDKQGIHDDQSSVTLQDDKSKKQYTLIEQIIKFVKGSNVKAYNGKQYILADGDNISLMMSTDNNVANYEVGSEGQIRPGSAGSIVFYLIPNEENLGKLDFTLDIKGYTVTPKTNDQAEMTEITNQKSLMTLLSGHMLFFQTKTEEGKYSEMINPVSEDITGQRIRLRMSVDMTKCVKDTPKEVKIYWIWPERFDNLFPQTGNKYILDTEKIVECNKLNSELTENWARFVPTYISDTLPTEGAENYEALLSQWTSGYNLGDQSIGTTVSFITVKISEKKES